MARETKAQPHRPLDLTAIVQDVDALWSEWNAWIHRETGQVYFLMEAGISDEDEEYDTEIDRLLEAGKLISWDPEPWDDNDRAERFIAQLEENEDARRIARAWYGRGRGRWARFKFALEEAGLREKWFDYRRECLRADVIRLLEAEGVAFREGS